MALSSSLHGERGGGVVWSHGSEGLHEMRGLEGVGGGGLSGCMGQRDCMR